MTTITHEEYQNLIFSEEEPYETAISMLPEEDRAGFLAALRDKTYCIHSATDINPDDVRDEQDFHQKDCYNG